MRAVSFVDKIELKFHGNLYKDAIALGDVDNDGHNELVVGNEEGTLAIFKGLNTKPWKVGTNFGMITSILVGDILNDGKNYVVCISGDGWCSIIDVENMPQKKNGNEDVSKQKTYEELTPFHTQRIPANIKVAILADILGDGAFELVVGMTDRVVRSYRWRKVPDSSTNSKGKLVGLSKWELAKQIGNISIGTDADGEKCLYIAQPGGTFVTLHCNKDPKNDSHLTPTPCYHALVSSRTRNVDVSSEVMGDVFIKKGSEDVKNRGVSCIATLDGTFMLISPKDEILWSLQVDHQLFILNKMNVTTDDQDEIIICSWDGQTYIVNHELQVIRFQFDEAVCTFCAGYFCINPQEDVPCLIYSTFNDKICVYYNVRLPAINTFSLLDVMDQKEDVQRLLSYLQVNPSNSNQLRQLYQWCLYGYPSKPSHDNT
ncbi:KICSTOR complex protein ITFG2 [Nymphon striatum]|nr:KICSTOR complex protein ITFG2 [Nymphon striatum]